MDQSRTFLVVAALFGLTGVALGAFGAHTLRSQISSEMLTVFETGVRYQMYHTFALFIAAFAMQSKPIKRFGIAGWLFVGGTVLFSGSLYVLAISGIRSLGIITPVGGLSLMAGWLMLILGFVQKKEG